MKNGFSSSGAQRRHVNPPSDQHCALKPPPPGPLRLQPVFLEKIWAKESFPEWMEVLLGAGPGVGEVWLASDRHHPTPIAEGRFKGRGLDEIVDQWPRWICGENSTDGFPLLLKVLSVGQWLSVQVHPDDDAARKLENESRGKSEAWHVLAAEDGSQIVHGVSSGTNRDRVYDALERGTIANLLEYVPARTGETFHIPPGTIHSLGPGLTILEIQQSSDLTYRFFDWNRAGLDGRLRELHVEKAVKVMTVTGAGSAVKPEPERARGHSVERLIRDPGFELLRCSVSATCGQHDDGPWLLFFHQGCGLIQARGFTDRLAEPGQTWMVPAGVESWQVTPVGEELVFFESHP